MSASSRSTSDAPFSPAEPPWTVYEVAYSGLLAALVAAFVHVARSVRTASSTADAADG